MGTGKSLAFEVLSAPALAAAYFVEQQPSFTTARVMRGDVEEAVLASGTLKPAGDGARGSQVSGRITDRRAQLEEKGHAHAQPADLGALGTDERTDRGLARAGRK